MVVVQLVTGAVGDDVIARAAIEEIVAVAAVDPVVATIAPDGVIVGLAGLQPVVAFGAAQHHGIAEEIVIADEVNRAIRQLLDEGFVENARQRGLQAQERLRGLQHWLPAIGDVRGEGLLVGRGRRGSGSGRGCPGG